MDLAKNPDVHKHLWTCVRTDFRAVLSEFLDSADWNFETFAELVKNKYLTLFYNWVGPPQGRGDYWRLKQYQAVAQLVLKAAKDVWLESTYNIELETENSKSCLSSEHLLMMNSTLEIKRMIGGLFLVWIMHQNQPMVDLNKYNIKMSAEDWKKVVQFETDVKQFKFELGHEKTQKLKNQISVIWLQLKGQGALDFIGCPSPDMFGADEANIRYIRTHRFLADNAIIQSVDPRMSRMICAPAKKLRAKFRRMIMEGQRRKTNNKSCQKMKNPDFLNTTTKITTQCNQTGAGTSVAVAYPTTSVGTSGTGAPLGGRVLLPETTSSGSGVAPSTTDELHSKSETEINETVNKLKEVKEAMADIETFLRTIKESSSDKVGSANQPKIEKTEEERALEKNGATASKGENCQKSMQIRKSLLEVGTGPLPEKLIQEIREVNKKSEPAVDKENQSNTPISFSKLDSYEDVGIPDSTNSQPNSPPPSPLTMRILKAIAKACELTEKKVSVQKRSNGRN